MIDFASPSPATSGDQAPGARRARGLAIVAPARIENAWPRLFASSLAALITLTVFDASLALPWLAGLVLVVLCDQWMFRRVKTRLAAGDANISMRRLVAWVSAQSAYGNLLAVLIWFAPIGDGPTLSVLYMCGGLANAASTLRHSPPLAAAGTMPTAAFLLALPVAEFLLDGARDPLDLAPLVGGLLLLAWGAKLWNSLVASDAALALAEAAAARERQAAAAAAAARSDTIRHVMNEFRTPFLAMSGACESLRRAASTPAARDHVGMLVQINGVLNRVLEDLGQLERPADKQRVLAERVDPRELVRGVVAAFRASAHDKSIELFLDVAPDAPTLVEVDPVRVRQVLANLIANAVQSTTYGGVRVRFSASPGAREGHVRLAFTIADTGGGVAPGKLAQALAQQSSRTDDGAVQSLSIAARWARLLGGDITARSEPGEGSFFTFAVDVQAVSLAGRDAA